MQQLAVSIEEAQIMSGLGRTKIYELMNAGVLPARKSGKRTLILKADLDAFLASLPSYPSQKVEAETIQ